MDANGERKISDSYYDYDYINLNFFLDSCDSDWNLVLQMFDERITGRFINPINSLISNNSLFAAMALVCLLIETLYQFHEGINETGPGNCRQYSNFLYSIMPSLFPTYRTAKIFYDHIRCGILHSGQTKHQSTLTLEHNLGVQVEGDSINVNVRSIINALEEYYNAYLQTLRNPRNVNLRGHFVQKMDYICCRDNDETLIRHFWPKIRHCANELFMTARGQQFSYYANQNAENRITIYNSNISLSRNTIKTALSNLYYQTSFHSMRGEAYISGILTDSRIMEERFFRQVRNGYV